RGEGTLVTIAEVMTLAIGKDTGRLYAGTGGAGIWFSDDQAETWE
ncbi:MAG: hypothetical protein HY232_04615, partial [Acidobacteria bacterium]|nr:hypothetical protein [Acidobacteriota bacterium]